MKYMLLIYGDENGLSETERKDCYVESTQLAHQLHSNGQYLAANQLHPTAMATSVRVRDGKRLVIDGPFAETREQLGGYFLIEAKDLDEAIAIAAKIPTARKGTVEVRPVIEIPGLPTAGCWKWPPASFSVVTLAATYPIGKELLLQLGVGG